MNITIGNLINYLLPYSNLLETKFICGVPFIRTGLRKESNVNIAMLYIIQTGEDRYSVLDTISDNFNDKYFPTGSIERPFISDKEFISHMFNSDENMNNEIVYIKNDISESMFVDYLLDILWYYNIIRLNPKKYDIKIIDMNFRSDKIKNIITNTFTRLGHQDGTVYDLLTVFIKEHKTFSLHGLRERELKHIQLQLKRVGIIAIIENETIVDIQLELQK